MLAMMNEVLPAHGALRNEEMQTYCYLLQGQFYFAFSSSFVLIFLYR